MGYGKDIIDHPVQNQSGREIEEHKSEHDRHQKHHLGLGRIGGRGGHLLLNDHGRPHDDRRDIDRVFRREILDPQEEGGMPHLDRILQGIIKGDEDRNLNHHGKASAHGVDLSPLIEEHDLLLKPCLVVLIGLSEPGHLRLDLLHLLHRFEADLCQRKKDDLDQDADQNDIDPIIFRHGVGQRL